MNLHVWKKDRKNVETFSLMNCKLQYQEEKDYPIPVTESTTLDGMKSLVKENYYLPRSLILRLSPTSLKKKCQKNPPDGKVECGKLKSEYLKVPDRILFDVKSHGGMEYFGRIRRNERKREALQAQVKNLENTAQLQQSQLNSQAVLLKSKEHEINEMRKHLRNLSDEFNMFKQQSSQGNYIQMTGIPTPIEGTHSFIPQEIRLQMTDPNHVVVPTWQGLNVLCDAVLVYPFEDTNKIREKFFHLVDRTGIPKHLKYLRGRCTFVSVTNDDESRCQGIIFPTDPEVKMMLIKKSTQLDHLKKFTIVDPIHQIRMQQVIPGKDFWELCEREAAKGDEGLRFELKQFLGIEYRPVIKDDLSYTLVKFDNYSGVDFCLKSIDGKMCNNVVLSIFASVTWELDNSERENRMLYVFGVDRNNLTIFDLKNYFRIYGTVVEVQKQEHNKVNDCYMVEFLSTGPVDYIMREVYCRKIVVIRGVEVMCGDFKSVREQGIFK